VGLGGAGAGLGRMDMSGGAAIWLFVISLVAAIMIHEAGHFVTARWFGMRADRFFLGFGPTLWSTHRGETEYGVKALPLGGFVRIKGMSPLDERLRPIVDTIFEPRALAEDREREAELVPATGGDTAASAAGAAFPETTWERLEAELRHRGTPQDVAERIVRRTRTSLSPEGGTGDARRTLTEVVVTEAPDTGRVGDLHHRLLEGDRDRFFQDRPAWQRAIVLVAGSVMHFVIAIAVLLAMFLFVPQPTGEVGPVVGDVLEDSPAEVGGLEVGDRLLGVGEARSDDYLELRELIRARPGQPTDLVVERGDETLVLTLTPEEVVDPETDETVGQVGFVPTEITERLDAGTAVYEAVLGPAGFVAIFTGSVAALVRVFSPEGISNLMQQATGTEERAVDGAVSLVGAASLAGQATSSVYGLLILLGLIASINIFIGIFNLVPLPPLDGGHLAVLGIERSVNAIRKARGKTPDFTVDPRAVAAVAIPVLAVLGTVFVVLLWLDITDPLRLPF
jgi:regulator of sigma E protease